MKGELVYYEGNNSGYALILWPGVSDGKANLLVFHSDDGDHSYVMNVPRREEGGGHTWRERE